MKKIKNLFKNKVSFYADEECIKIYINKILHIRIPRDKNTKIQSWIERSSGKNIIEIHCNKSKEKYEYEDSNLWIEILKVLDKNL